MRFYKLIAAVAMGLIAGRLQAQSPLTANYTPIPHLYQNNYLYLNPAFAGSEGKQEFNFSGRKRSIDEKGGPMTGIFSYHRRVGEDTLQSGVGLVVSFDQNEPFWKGKFGFIYSRGIRIARDIRLAAGVQVNGKYLDVDFDVWKQNKTNAPNITGHDNDFRTDVDAGLWFTAGHFFAGGSILNLLEPDFRFKVESTSRQERRQLVTTAGYKFILGNNLFLTPTFLWHKKELKEPQSELSFSTTATLKFIVLGATYRGRYDNITPWVGFAGLQFNDHVQLLISTDVPENTYKDFYRNNVEANLKIKF